MFKISFAYDAALAQVRTHFIGNVKLLKPQNFDALFGQPVTGRCAHGANTKHYHIKICLLIVICDTNELFHFFMSCFKFTYRSAGGKLHAFYN
jgi:hypothetical protein